jgi:segregation and condensation protein B
MTLKTIVEALIFASQKPLMPKEIVAVLRGAAGEGDDPETAEFAKTKPPEIAETLETLREEYDQLGRAFQLVEQVNGWLIVTKPDTARWVRQLYPESRPTRLSGPALETLAIIAYRQPIMKADIEAVRGVAVDGVVQSLLERSLIKIHGRAEVPGRPLLYATSEYFLEHFGLKTLDELPNTSELRRIQLPTAPKKKEEKPSEKPAPTTQNDASPVAEPEPAPEAEASNSAPEVSSNPTLTPDSEPPEESKNPLSSETNHVAE